MKRLMYQSGRFLFVLLTFVPMQFNGPEWDNSICAAWRFIRDGE